MPNCYIPVISSLNFNLSINDKYAQFIENNGYEAVPLLFPWSWAKTDKKLNNIKKMRIDENDILLLPGGQDIDPIPFGYRNLACKHTNRIRDYIESSLMEIAMEKDIKIFGICRGFQLFFISQLSRISKWWQHVNDHLQESPRDIETHFVTLHTPLLSKYSKYHEYGNENSMAVNSMHHQAIELKGNSYGEFRVETIGTVTEEGDKKKLTIVEAARVYKQDKLVFAGVQWHPEELESQQDLIKVMLEV